MDIEQPIRGDNNNPSERTTRFQEILDRSKKNIHNEIETIKQDIQKVFNEISSLRDDLKNIEKNKTQSSEKITIHKLNKEIPKEENKKELKKPKEDFSDISVEKMFYYGKK